MPFIHGPTICNIIPTLETWVRIGFLWPQGWPLAETHHPPEHLCSHLASFGNQHHPGISLYMQLFVPGNQLAKLLQLWLHIKNWGQSKCVYIYMDICTSGRVQLRHGTEICNFGEFSPLDFLNFLQWICCCFSRFSVQLSKEITPKRGENWLMSRRRKIVESCHVSGCHGFFTRIYNTASADKVYPLRNLYSFRFEFLKTSSHTSRNRCLIKGGENYKCLDLRLDGKASSCNVTVEGLGLCSCTHPLFSKKCKFWVDSLQYAVAALGRQNYFSIIIGKIL